MSLRSPLQKERTHNLEVRDQEWRDPSLVIFLIFCFFNVLLSVQSRTERDEMNFHASVSVS